MNYSENKIYIQTAYQGVRNKDILNVNTSSDFCVFESPNFTVSGASKIDFCGGEVSCTISGSLEVAYIAARAVCFTGNDLEESCLELSHYENRISADGEVIYSADFYTSTAYTGDYPSGTLYRDSIITAFDALGYTYTYTGTTFTIDKPYGVNQLNLDVNINFDLTDDCMYTSTGCTSCPSGYTETVAGDACVYSATTAATFNGSGSTIVAGDTNADYSTNGTYFYTNETNNESLPLFRGVSNLATLEDQSGGTISWTNISAPANTFWDSNGSSANGRLNNTSLSGSSSEWLGFSDCIDIVSGGTYYIGIGADNYCRFSIDGDLFLSLSAATDKNHKIWHVLPYEFSSGKHIIEMEGKNAGGASGFGAEIYFPTDLATLTAATTTGDTGLIFSTADKVGDLFDIGSTIGYSCPTGWALDLCGMSAVCTELIYTAATGTCLSAFTGTCLGSTTNVCEYDFSGLTSANTAIHIITTATSQDITFEFTANTQSFVDTNATFKYEIYKYDNSSANFHKPAQYRIGEVEWSTFSGTSAFTSSIPLTALRPDGEYLIKGGFVHDVCTEYANRLGYRYDTSSYVSGKEYGLYNPASDFYMAIINEAATPELLAVNADGGSIGAIKQYSVIPTDGQTVFFLSDSVGLDFFVTLNGLTLSREDDYGVTQFSGGSNPYIVTLSAETYSTDILSFIYVTKGNEVSLVTDTVDVTSIPSGPTDGEGSNKIYYNTTTSKYEVFTSLTPRNGNDFILMVNGATLVFGIDYFQSISNPKRLIFEGTILVGDIIVIGYNANAPYVGSIDTSTPTIFWNINRVPQLINGEFILEFATDEAMTNVVSSSATEYIVGESNYNTSGLIVGSVGTQLYYRVTNNKNYVTICGDIVQSTAHSETIPITIATNSINSY